MPGRVTVSGAPWTQGTTPTRSRTTQRASVNQVQADAAAALPQGVVPYIFGRDNVAASLAASQLYRALPGSAMVTAQIAVTAMFPGEVVAIGLHANAAKTAGTAELEVYVDGDPSGAILEWENVQYAIQRFGRGIYTFDADAELDIRLTTSSGFLPITVDLEVILYIAQRAQDLA